VLQATGFKLQAYSHDKQNNIRRSFFLLLSLRPAA
jgi:hypothetical protein